MKQFGIAASALLLVATSTWSQLAPPQRLAPNDVKSGTTVGSIDLGPIFPQMQGYVLMERLTTVAPGFGMPWHSHAGRPEIMRVLSGTLTDARDGGPPKTYGVGSTLINDGKTRHTWANLGSEQLVLLSATVLPSNAVNQLPK